ncbi:DedA family protein [Sinomonas humi]|uniref:Membrane protein n=1 Tax=Sinomonas humi TaxID=1338436 RepID=A0A0B2AM17_9MICC|nr:DedA family protein [Sinomonas humi]KHL02911.1 membrane protein [Sinomonas humi]
MGAIVDVILGMPPLLAYVLVFAFVFAEDAIFVGFVIPGETAAVLGGVIASQGKATVWLMAPLVVLAAIAGDSVGYEIGKHLGPRFLDSKPLRKHRKRLDDAQDFLRRRGGWAVFLGRFVAFFRAVMPALAGASRMRYLKFLAFNALGGFTWGIGYVLLGFLAGASYEAVAKAAGRDITAGVVVLAIIAVIVWRVRKSRRERREERGEASGA